MTVQRPLIAHTYPANEDAALDLLQQPQNDEGRSEFRWITLANGDVGLIVFPQGDTFFDLETTFEADHKDAEANGTISVLWAESMAEVEVGPECPPRYENVTWPEPVDRRQAIYDAAFHVLANMEYDEGTPADVLADHIAARANTMLGGAT